MKTLLVFITLLSFSMTVSYAQDSTQLIKNVLLPHVFSVVTTTGDSVGPDGSVRIVVKDFADPKYKIMKMIYNQFHISEDDHDYAAPIIFVIDEPDPSLPRKGSVNIMNNDVEQTIPLSKLNKRIWKAILNLNLSEIENITRVPHQ